MIDSPFLIDMSIDQQVELFKKPWEGSSYYQNAEQWTFVFWDEGHKFKKYFDQLDLTNLLELSCGHGRHAEKSAPLAGRLNLIDIIEENVDYCQNRLRNFGNIEYFLGDGKSFTGIKKNSLSAIYCYDAMVHFPPDIVEMYLKDTARVLRSGGRALYHHSNYSDSTTFVKGGTPGARGYMTTELFNEMVKAAGLVLLEQEVINWGGVEDLDCISLLEKR